jgi:nicotinamidase/pyrazinamidase
MSNDRSALLIIDVQNDFCAGGALPVPDAERVVPVLNRHIAEAITRGEPVYASRDWHPRMTRHFNANGGDWPPHCVQDTHGARFHADLQLPASGRIISKGQDADTHGYSAFEGRTPDGKTLLADLRARQITHVSIGGLATDYCVKYSVLDALRAGLSVTVFCDAIAGIDVHPGDVDRAFAEMRQAGALLA